VSRAGRCDGTRDCPNEEDELHCNGTRGSKGECIRRPFIFYLMCTVFKPLQYQVLSGITC
jgi:hypothetical protein